MGADYRSGSLRDMLTVPGVATVFDTRGDTGGQFVALASDPALIRRLYIEGRDITQSGTHVLSVVDSTEGGHYDRVDIAPVQLSAEAHAFVRNPDHHAVIVGAYLRHAVPLRNTDPGARFAFRTSDGEIETVSRVDSWSDATLEGSVTLGLSSVDISRSQRCEDPDGTVAFSRLATTRLEHNLAGARLQISWVTPDGRLGSTVPGYGRHPLGLVDALNPTIGYLTFAPANYRLAAALEVLAYRRRGDIGVLTSPGFREAVNNRAYQDHPWLRWVELGLAAGDRVGLVAQAWQIAAGNRDAPPLDLGVACADGVGGDRPMESDDTDAVQEYLQALSELDLDSETLPTYGEITEQLAADFSVTIPTTLTPDAATVRAGDDELEKLLTRELDGSSDPSANSIDEVAREADELTRPRGPRVAGSVTESRDARQPEHREDRPTE